MAAGRAAVRGGDPVGRRPLGPAPPALLLRGLPAAGQGMGLHSRPLQRAPHQGLRGAEPGPGRAAGIRRHLPRAPARAGGAGHLARLRDAALRLPPRADPPLLRHVKRRATGRPGPPGGAPARPALPDEPPRKPTRRRGADPMSKERTGQRHKNKVYFKDPDLDLYLQAFPLNHLSYGGAAAGEIFYAASRIDEKDLESWVGEWSFLATRLESEAATALERDHIVSSRES